MLRSVLALALALALAAVPAHAQESTLASTAWAPLPALLRPDAQPLRRVGVGTQEPDVGRIVLIGAGAGCVVLGAIAYVVDGNAHDGRLTDGLKGCGLGALAGGTIAFMSTVRPEPWRYWMEIGRTLRVWDRAAWRAWLQEHHATEPEVWLVYPRKATGQARIAYNDAVEEALCFGWIDSTVKTLDADHTAQRFTPRRAGSGYSQTNKERLRRLIAAGRVADPVLERLRDVPLDDFAMPPDIERALRANPAAWQNLQRWSDAYLRIRVAYVHDARDRGDEFGKRLANLVRKSEQGKQFGFGIESYY